MFELFSITDQSHWPWVAIYYIGQGMTILFAGTAWIVSTWNLINSLSETGEKQKR